MAASRMFERHLAREQHAFLGRSRAGWGPHLERTRGLIADAFRQADPSRPILVLGAGSGLEVPWGEAPRRTVAWDADPWSRVRTLLRHRRWVPWHFGDATGAFGPLEAMVARNLRQDWRGRPLGRPEVARARIAGLLDSLPTHPATLEQTLRTLGPGLVVAANLMGQFGAVAESLMEQAFGVAPWEEDPERRDPLAEALDRWTARSVGAFLGVLRDSGAALALIHDRAILDRRVDLGPWTPDWRMQLGGPDTLEVWDPLCGVDVPAVFQRTPQWAERWLWPVGPGQVHLVEALGFSATGT